MSTSQDNPRRSSVDYTETPLLTSTPTPGAGKFLGYIISESDIKPDPTKVQAILDMAAPATVKDIQSLNGRLASLNRFLSRSAQQSLPFLKILKEKTTKGKDIKWTPDAEAAFQDLKAHLLQLPTLTTPLPGETLFVYLAVSTDSISTVLIRDDRGVQRPVYFVSKLLQGAEMRYSEVEKLALALVHAARRLRHYFQAHPIHVLTNHPLRQILLKPEASGRLVKWAVELGEHDISYIPRRAIKG